MKLICVNFRPCLLSVVTLSCWISAHSAPANASHGLVPFSSSLTNQILQMGNLDLKQVAHQAKNGLQTEPAKTRNEWQKHAREYAALRIRYARGKNVRDQLSDCEHNRNFFCRFEDDRVEALEENQEAKLARMKDRQQNFSKAKVLSWIKSLDLDQLSLTPFTNLISAAGQLQDGSRELTALTDRLLNANDNCQSGSLYTAVGGRWEDELPNVDAQNKVMALYERAAKCSKDAASMQARYRLALFSIAKNDCSNVNDLMKDVEGSAEQSALHTRAKYWRHYCGLQNRQADVVLETRESLLNNYPLSYHNLALNGENSRITDYLLNNGVDGKSSAKVQLRSIINPDLNASIQAVESLIMIDQPRLAGEILEHSMKDWQSTEPDVRLYLAALAHQADLGVTKFKLLSQLFNDSTKKIRKDTLELFFPSEYMNEIKKNAKTVDPLLVVSLIRQESAFDQNARSSVGARGLMQVMPATARSIASVNTKNLMDPSTNIRVGTKYLQYRLNHFDGDVELTLAAYNAGFARVAIWKKRYQVTNKLLFLDLIPYKETREYVATILRNYYWYSKLYDPAMNPNQLVPAAPSGNEQTKSTTEKSTSGKSTRHKQRIQAIMQANSGAFKSHLQ